MKKCLTTLLVAGFLTSGVYAQNTDSKPQLVERDPFINQMQSEVLVPIKPVRPKPIINPRPDHNPDIELVNPNPTSTETSELQLPDVTVSGIVTSASGSQAILSTPTGEVMVVPGQKLGDFEVVTIGRTFVELKAGEQSDFRISLKS